MITKNHIKFIQSLQLKKHRQESGLFIVEGLKMVEELLLSMGWEVEEVLATEDWIHGHANRFDFSNIKLTPVSTQELKQISGLSTPNELLALVKTPDYTLDNEKLKSQLTITLDAIQDPGNLGTIIRIADWFGIQQIICGEGSVEVYNPKVVQATMGSLFRVQVHYTSLDNLFSSIKGTVPVYGALLDGENMYKNELQTNGILLMGNESKGISPLLLPFITHKIKIPSYSVGLGAESLNVGVATALICAEFRRRS